MEDRSLRQCLRRFCEDAAAQLAEDARNGEEVPFELVDAGEGGPGGTPLWCYRTLTGEFIRARLGVLGMLPSYMPAATALERVDGIEDWLRARGEQAPLRTARDRADAALRVFLTEVIGESTTFEFDRERFSSAWASLDAIAFAGESTTVLAAPIHGLAIESAELALGEGTVLVRRESPQAEILPPDIFRDEGAPLAVALIEIDDAGPQGLAAARSRLRKLVSALRLSAVASPSFGGAGRVSVEGGPWQPVGLGGSGVPDGVLSVASGAEAELRAFCNLVHERWPSRGEVAWALRRHELGCDRLHHLDALSDHLLALRALLEPEGPASGRLTARLAALCAEPDGRAVLAERTARAIALERSLMSGRIGGEDEAQALCDEISMHLRALLRDVICGHLDSDLCGIADSIIAKAAGIEGVPSRRGFGDPEPVAA